MAHSFFVDEKFVCFPPSECQLEEGRQTSLNAIFKFLFRHEIIEIEEFFLQLEIALELALLEIVNRSRMTNNDWLLIIIQFYNPRPKSQVNNFSIFVLI